MRSNSSKNWSYVISHRAHKNPGVLFSFESQWVWSTYMQSIFFQMNVMLIANVLWFFNVSKQLTHLFCRLFMTIISVEICRHSLKLFQNIPVDAKFYLFQLSLPLRQSFEGYTFLYKVLDKVSCSKMLFKISQ